MKKFKVTFIFALLILNLGFEISDEAKDMFKNIRGPFGIVSVAGMYRTGKSYLLNKVLLNLEKGKGGFGVGPSINPCTKVSSPL